MEEHNSVPPLPRGTQDILPATHEYFTYIKKVVRHRCRQAGFRRISTPIWQHRDLFEKTLGANDEVLQKLYTFKNHEGKDITLRPEGFSGIVRAYLAHNMDTLPQPVELFFIEPFFRAENEQKTCMSSFHQFGVITLGEDDAALGAQVIQLAFKVLRDLGLEALFNLRLNSLGCKECRPKFLADFQSFYFGKERSLCDRCKNFVSSNPLHLLSCQEEDCKILTSLAPQLEPYICRDCKTLHEEFMEYLHELCIPYKKDPHLIPHRDYFTKTVFGFASNDNEYERVCVGGRADGMVEALGGHQGVPIFGFSMGVERLIESMKKEKIRVPSKDDVHIFVAQLGKIAKKKCLLLIDKLREEGIKTVGALGKGSMREQIDMATKFGVPYMVILGITEVRENTAILRNMKLGQQRIMPFSEVLPEIKNLLGEEKLDKYSPGEILY